MVFLEPQYLIFELPFLAALLYVVLLATGAVAEHDGDADTDVDADLDHDLDTDLDAVHGIDHDGDHDLDHDGDHDHDDDADGGGALLRVLSFFGFGKVPISILITSFCFLWGFFGWASNVVLSSFIPFPAVYIVPSLVVATVASVFLIRHLATLLGKAMPKTENYAVTVASLVGRSGTLKYATSETFGAAHVYDRSGNQHEVRTRVREGKPSLPQGTVVVLAAYDETKGLFYVETEAEFDERMFVDSARRRG